MKRIQAEIGIFKHTESYIAEHVMEIYTHIEIF